MGNPIGDHTGDSMETQWESPMGDLPDLGKGILAGSLYETSLSRRDTMMDFILGAVLARHWEKTNGLTPQRPQVP